MEYSEKIACLRRYREAVQREETLAQEIEALRCQAARVTQAITGMPGGGDGQAIPGAVVAAHDGSRVLLDRQRPRVEIEIIEMED